MLEFRSNIIIMLGLENINEFFWNKTKLLVILRSGREIHLSTSICRYTIVRIVIDSISSFFFRTREKRIRYFYDDSYMPYIVHRRLSVYWTNFSSPSIAFLLYSGKSRDQYYNDWRYSYESRKFISVQNDYVNRISCRLWIPLRQGIVPYWRRLFDIYDDLD